MDLTEMLAELTKDLKMTLGSEISETEAIRCINRAVDDLSRHIPRERIYEHTWVEAVTDDSFTTPAAANATSLVNAADISATVDGGTLTLVTTWLDVSRPVAFLLTDAGSSITRLTLIIKGIDADGVYREERFYRHNGKSQTGKVYFATIYEVEVNEIAGNGAADTISLGYASPSTTGAEVWVQLDHPVEPDTQTIYSGAGKTGTKYTLDTDYEMDWANGRIRLKSGSSMAAATTYYANYDKHNLMVDISPILTELTRVVKVVYPADKIPEQQVAFSIWENMLTIGSQRSGESQKALEDKEHLAIYYESRHTPPTYVGPGSYPEYLDQVVLIGAGGYALLIEALQYELQAVTDLASARTELGLTTAIHTLVVTALAKVATYLETNGTTDNAQDVLANVTDDIANLRTAIATALDAANAYLDEVDTTDLGQATVGAEGYLETGDDLINQLNNGKDVPSIYATYSTTRAQHAQVRTQAALGFVQEAVNRLDNIRTYIQESEEWRQIGLTFVNEADSRINEIRAHIEEAAQYQQIIANDMLLSDRFRVEGNARLDKFNELLKSRGEYRKRIVDVSVRQPK